MGRNRNLEKGPQSHETRHLITVTNAIDATLVFLKVVIVISFVWVVKKFASATPKNSSLGNLWEIRPKVISGKIGRLNKKKLKSSSSCSRVVVDYGRLGGCAESALTNKKLKTKDCRDLHNEH